MGWLVSRYFHRDFLGEEETKEQWSLSWWGSEVTLGITVSVTVLYQAARPD